MFGPLVAQHPGLEIELLADPRPLNLVRRAADIAVRPSRFEHQDVVEVEAGVGLACLPRIVGDETPCLHFLPAPLPGPERRLWVAAHRDARGIPRIRSTLAFLKEGLRRARPALSPRH